MSLKGGKLLCLNENAQVKKILKPKGKSFKVGEYFSCDYIYEDGKSKSGIYFEIAVDAFGRITIINHIHENPIIVNGKTIQNKGNLFNGNSIKALDKEFLWQFSIPKNKTVNDADKKLTTPESIKCINKPASYSEERFDKQYINFNRLTVHSFLDWIRPKSLEITEEASHITLDEKSAFSNTLLNKTNSVMQTVEQENEKSPITVTNHGARLSSEKLLDISNKENNIPENEKLSKCRVSEILCISCTPNTKFNTTSNSIYSTPKSILAEHNSIDNENSPNLINFSTPEPNNSSMHFIDLITPIKHHHHTPQRKPPTTLLKSALKNSARSVLKSRNKSAKKNDQLNENAEKIKLRCRETFKDLNKDTTTPSSLLSKPPKTINENQVDDHSKNVEILLNSTVESLSVIDLDLESSVNVENSIIEISNDSSSPIDSSPQAKHIDNSNSTPSKSLKLQTPNKSTVKKAVISNTQKKLPKLQPPSLSSSSSLLSKTVAIPKTTFIKKLPSPIIRNNKLNVSSITKTVNSPFRCPSSMKTNAGKTILKNTSLLKSKASASVNLKQNSSIPLRRSQSETKAILLTTNSSTTDKKTILLKRLQEKSLASVGRRRLDYAASTSKIETTMKNSSIIKNPINNKKFNQSLQNHKTSCISKVPTFKLSKSVIEKTLEKPIKKNNLSKTLTSSTSIRSNKKILGKQYTTSVTKEKKTVSQNLNEINNIIIDKEKIINEEEKLENITEIQKDNSNQVNKISNSLQEDNVNENIMKNSFIEDQKIQKKLNKTFEIDQIEVNESLNKTFDLGNESYSHLKEVSHQKIVSNEMEICNEESKIVMLSKPEIVEINEINKISITKKEPSLTEEKQQKDEQQQLQGEEKEEEQNNDIESRDNHSPIVQDKYEDDTNDDIFKTPSAKMLMMLGTPKSANVIEKINIDNETTQKLYDIQEEIERYTETDDDIQEIESINDEKEITIDSLNITANNENDPLNFEAIFDKLAGKPIIKKCYSNKSSLNQSKYSIISNTTSSSLFINETSNDTQQENFPSTDVEQWIDDINKCKENNESIVKEIPGNMSGIIAFDETNQSHFTEHLIFSDSDEETDKENQQQKQSITSETSNNETSLEISKISVKNSHLEIIERNDSSIFQDESCFNMDDDDDDYDKTLIEKLGNDKSILLHSRARSFSPQFENSLLSDTSKQNIYHDYVLENLSKSDKNEDIHNESAFEKFEELPEFKKNRGHSMSLSLKATEKNENTKTTRRTMYSKPQNSSFDLNIARTEFEKKEAFKNFNFMPKFRITRVKSTEHITSKKVSHASRKTLYHKTLDSSFDINVAKAEYEIKDAFKNFDSEKTVQARGKSVERELQKNERGISRKTLYHEPLDSSFDINVAKAEYEIKEAFKNFDSQKTVQARGKSAERELQKNERGISRKTLYHEPLDSSFDINVAKAEYEIKEAFKNFDSQKTVQARGKSAERELQKNERGISRKTLYHEPLDSSFDINVAKTEYEIKEAFKNFDSEKTVQTRGKSAERELQKNERGISRKTLYHDPLDSSFDINVAKTEYELKEAFKNFDSEKIVQARGKSVERELQKNERGISRKTLYHEPLDSSFDINVAKTEYEIKEAFKNFDSEKTVQPRGKSAERELQKNERGISRKTLYHEPLDSSFNINVAKTEYEIREAFKNFSCEPNIHSKRTKSMNEIFENEISPSLILNKTVNQKPCLDSSFDLLKEKEKYKLKIVSTNQECVENDENQKNVPVKSDQKYQSEEIATNSNQESIEKKETENNDSLIVIDKIDDILKTKSQSTPVIATHDKNLITPLKKSDKDVFLTPVTTAKRTRQTRKKEIQSTFISTTPSENNVNDESSIMNYSSFLTPLRRSQRTTKGKKPALFQENDNSMVYQLNSSAVASEITTRRGRGGRRNLKDLTKLSDEPEKAEIVEKNEVTREKINTNKEEKLITETEPVKGRGQKKENLKIKIEADEEEQKNNENLAKNNESTTNQTSKKSQENENESTVKTRSRKCKNLKLVVKEKGEKKDEVNTSVSPVIIQKHEIKEELNFEINDTENEALIETTLQQDESKKLKKNTRKRKNLEVKKTEILENKIHANQESADVIKREFEITVASEEATVTRRTTRRNQKKEFVNDKGQNLKIENHQIESVKEENEEVKNISENIQNEIKEKNGDYLLNKEETNKKQRATRKKVDKKENLILKDNMISEKKQDHSKSNEEEPKVNEEHFLNKNETIKSNRTTRRNQIHNVHENEANCKSENKDDKFEEQKENLKKTRPKRGKNVEKEDNIKKVENVAMESSKEDISERLSGDSSEKVEEEKVCEEKIENYQEVKNENKPVDTKPRRVGRKRKNENDSEIAEKVSENQNNIVDSNSLEESPSKLAKIKEKEEKHKNTRQRKGRKRKSESEDEELQESSSEKLSEKQKKTKKNDSKTTGKVSENQNDIESNSSKESPSKLTKIKEKEVKNDTTNTRKLRKRKNENEDEKLQETSSEKQKKIEEKETSAKENKTEQIDDNNQEKLKSGRSGRLRGKIDNKVKNDEENDISIQPVVTETKRITRRRK